MIYASLASEQTDDLRRLAQKAEALWLARSQTPELCKVEQARPRKQHQKINNQEDFCYYHRRYGKNARQCRHHVPFRETSKPVAGRVYGDRRIE